MEEKTISGVHQLCLIALMSAVMCLIGPLSIPIGEVPVSAATLIIYLTVYLLGTKMGTISCIIYLLLGFAGLPVFSGYTAGAAKLLGPTGGYLIGYIFMALICGLFMEKSGYKMLWCITGMIIGTAVLYLFGTVWFMSVYAKSSGAIGLVTVLSWCVIPFIIPDVIKIMLALFLAKQLSRVVQID